MPQIVSANRLIDGLVVFLSTGDRWVEAIAGAEVFADKVALDAGLARAAAAIARNIVVEVAAVEVDMTPRGLHPRHIRDRIRARGPTVHPAHGKQAEAR